MPRNKDLAARLAYEANRAYCKSIGDNSFKPWDEADDWQRDSCRSGVEFNWDGTTTAEQSHENWLQDKAVAGWTYGPVKDVEAKKHPCLVPYGDLPEDQRVKDSIFRSVVLSVKEVFG